MSKISIIGGGNIGRTIAYNLTVYKKICDEVVLFDIIEGSPQGMTLDILQAATVFGEKVNLRGSNDYSDIADSDVIIISAGMPRKPGMTREDLLSINIKIINDVSAQIKKYAPKAFIIVITNPLDSMVWAAYKALEFNKTHIIGMAGVLDSARLNYQISQFLGVEASTVQSMVIGAHNDTMVPLARYSTVSGIPITQLISKEEINNIFNKVKTGGAEIVGLLKTGSAYFNPAISSILMADSYLNNHTRILSCSTLLQGEYGVDNLFVGVPVLINKLGATKVIELELNEQEKADFEISVESVRKSIQ